MYQLLDKTSERVIGIRVSQQLTEEDYKTLIPFSLNANEKTVKTEKPEIKQNYN